MPLLRLLFLAFCLCLAPCTPRAADLFILDDEMPCADRLSSLRIAPDRELLPIYTFAADVYREIKTMPPSALAQEKRPPSLGTYFKDAYSQGPANLREQAFNGDMDALFALAAMSRLAEEEKRPVLFGAPAAFWEDWAVRMLGDKEAWFRIAAALFECSRANGLPKTKLEQMTAAALRKAAGLGHPEAMFALAYLAVPYPDKAFQMPKDPGFTILPSTTDGPEDDSEFRYWMSAATFHGSARAAYVSGIVYCKRDPRLRDERKCFEMFSQSLRLGDTRAARLLQAISTPKANGGIPRYASCKSSVYFGAIDERLSDNEMIKLANHNLMESMMHGKSKQFPEACLTRKEYKEAIREAEQEAERIKAVMRAKREAHDALYAKAQPMCAEMRAAFAAQGKAAPAEKSAAN